MHMKQLLEVFGSFLRENVDMVDTLLATAQQHTPTAVVKTSTSKSAVFTDAGSRANRKELLDFMKQNLSLPDIDVETIVGTAKDGSGVYQLEMLKDGKRIYRITLKQGKIGREDTPNAEKFEGNLANALNAGKGCEQILGAGPKFDALAAKVVKSISSPLLKNNCFIKLENKKVALSPSYTEHGVKSTTPKTDLISDDGSIRISVKKKGGQFISAQGPETAAVFMNAALPKSKAKSLFGEIIKTFFDYEKGYAVKAGTPQEKKKIQLVRDFLTKRLLNAGGLDLVESVVREALLGENKFMNPQAIPNYFLVWDEDGNGEFYTADKFVKKVAAGANISVRGRGGTRGLSLRGEV